MEEHHTLMEQVALAIGFIAAILAILAAIFLGYFAYISENVQVNQACTQEAKLCPDGTAVGRTGPNCEFALCPSTPSTSSGQGRSGQFESDVSNWKTYRNAKYGFGIGLPSNFKVIESTYNSDDRFRDYVRIRGRS